MSPVMSLPHTHTHRQNEHRNTVFISCYNDKSIFCYNLQIQYISDFGHSQTIYQTTSVRNRTEHRTWHCLPRLWQYYPQSWYHMLWWSWGTLYCEVFPCQSHHYWIFCSVAQGCIKNKNLVTQGGGINSYFDFLGKINSIFPLNKSKNKDFIIKI